MTPSEEKKVGENLQTQGLEKAFLGLTPKVHSIKEKFDKMDLITIRKKKNFCYVKDPEDKCISQAGDWEKIVAHHIYKE